MSSPSFHVSDPLIKLISDLRPGFPLAFHYAETYRVGASDWWIVRPFVRGMKYVGKEIESVECFSARETAEAIFRMSWQVYNSLNRKEPEPMRALYEVFIVGIESWEILHHSHHVAESEKEATVEAAVAAKLAKVIDRAKGNHFIVREIGAVPDAKKG